MRFSPLPRFHQDWAALDPAARARFHGALRERGSLGPGRARRVHGTTDVWESIWPGVRATWQFAADSTRDAPHVVWRRIAARP